jgi:RyR domain/TrkA-N domain
MLNSLIHFMRLAKRLSSTAARNRFQWQAIAGAVTLVLGYWGWTLQMPPDDFTGWVNNLFRTIQLVTLQFPTSIEKDLPWQLQVARLAVPLIAALATFDVIVGAITRPVRLAIMPHVRGHIIVVGVDRIAEAALRTLAARGQQIVIVVASISGAQQERLESFGFTILEADPDQPSTFSGLNIAKAAALFLIYDEDVKNIELAMQIMALNEKRALNAPRLVLALQIARDDLARELDPTLDALTRTKRARYDRLCIDRDTIREDLRLLAPVYLKQDTTTRSHVLVFGLSGNWQQVLMQLIISAQDHPDLSAAITLVANLEEKAKLAAWLQTMPDLHLVAQIAVLDGDSGLLSSAATLETWPFRTLAPQLVVVLRPDPDSVGTVLALRRRGNAFGIDVQPILVRRTREDTLLSQLAGSGPRNIPFGGILRTATMERVLDHKGDDNAMKLHQHYVERASTLPPGSLNALNAWEQLSENLRHANRASAEHAPILFKAMGLEKHDLASLSPESLDRLARIEHRRWMADRLDRGWRSGAARDDDRLIHPNIVPFDALSADDQEKDRDAVRVHARILSGQI